MNGVFLDTVGLIAVWVKSDQWHSVAQQRFLELLQAKVPLVSTPHVFYECGNATSRRPYRKRVNALRRQSQESGLLIEPASEEMVIAWQAFDRGDAGGAGIVDQVSFIVMRRLGITKAFTNDRHFVAAGFETLF